MVLMKKLKIIVFGLLILLVPNSYAQKNAPTGLLCNLLSHPEWSAITHRIPDFGWVVNPGVKADYQTAYEIQVATSSELLQEGHPDLWSSGKIQSHQSINIKYDGRRLEPHRSYWWRVRTWGRTGRPAPWSARQQFNTSSFDAVRAWPGESKWLTVSDAQGEEFWTFENRHPIRYYDVTPVRVGPPVNGGQLYDFGRAAFAYLAFNLTWETAAAQAQNNSLRLSIGEKAAGDSIDPKPGGCIVYQEYQLQLKPGTHDYRLEIPRFVPKYPHSQTMPQQMPEVIPFRYCEIKLKPGLTVNKITQKALYSLYDQNAASFACSDERLNAIYELCKYSTIANTFNGDYAGSERERMMYEADAYIQQMCHYAIDREFTVARYALENLIYHATWPTEWIPHSVLMAWADYMHTGNTRVIESYYDDLRAKTLMGLEMPDGLISTRTGLQSKEFLKSIHFKGEKLNDIVDWPDGWQGIQPHGETDHYEFKDYNTVVNAFYYRSLVLMAELARAINRTADVEFFEAKAGKVKRVFNEKFFDITNGIYTDGIGSTHASLHANMFPLAFGLVPNANKDSVVNYIKGKWMACGVYAANFLMEGLYDAGQGQYALDLMTNDSDRGWLNMIRSGATMTIEAWDQKYKPGDMSWNHAWSASPAHLIPRRIMGIKPAEPGFGKIIIKPQPGDLKWAKVKLPTIRGDILASLSQNAGDKFELHITIPANTTATVYLPKMSDHYSLTVDGKSIKDATVEGSWVVLDCKSGSHSFSIKQKR